MSTHSAGKIVPAESTIALYPGIDTNRPDTRSIRDNNRSNSIFIPYMYRSMWHAFFLLPSTSSATMTTGRDDVRGTKWFGHENSTDTTESTPDRNVARLFGHTLPKSTILANQKPTLSSRATKITLQDPWECYEARARIFLERNIILARRRDRKFELVNVQRLTVGPGVAQSLVEVISRCPHQSFLRLHGFLEHGNCYFLVWEPAEFTLNEVLASECYITEAELAQIVWPV